MDWELWSMECGVLSTERGVWGVDFEVWSDECGVLIVECRHGNFTRIKFGVLKFTPKNIVYYGVFCVVRKIKTLEKNWAHFDVALNSSNLNIKPHILPLSNGPKKITN